MLELELFRGVVPFVAVVEEQSFRRAAERLRVSPAAISKAVQKLESEVGVTLLVRSARSMRLTREGQLLFDRCQQATATVKGARQALEPSGRIPHGELVVSAPFVVTSLLAPGLALLRARHPQLTFRVTITDRLSRLAEESVDVAVRVGNLIDSSLIARKLCTTRLVTVASPNYLSTRKPPRTVSDLADHDCLSLRAPNGKAHPWVFASGIQHVTATMLVDHGPMLIDAALAGLGVTQAFDFMVERLVREGQLTQVLPEEVANGPDIHAICAPGRRPPARVKAAFGAFADAFAVGAMQSL